ncbi:MAG: low affinity iron permease family protein [Sphingomicrobium sp.]
MTRIFSIIASRTALWLGQPGAFIGASLACIVWAVSGPVFNYSDTWQLVINTVTTVLTFLAVFLIQNSQNRDGAAIQAKLDELLRAVDNARSRFIGIEHLTDKQIDLIRLALEKQAAAVKAQGGADEDAVDQLLDRF